MGPLKHSKFEPMWFKMAFRTAYFSLLSSHAPLLCHLRTPKTIAKVCISAHWRLFHPHICDLTALDMQDDLTFIIFGVQNGLPWLNDSFQLPLFTEMYVFLMKNNTFRVSMSTWAFKKCSLTRPWSLFLRAQNSTSGDPFRFPNHSRQ